MEEKGRTVYFAQDVVYDYYQDPNLWTKIESALAENSTFSFMGASYKVESIDAALAKGGYLQPIARCREVLADTQ